MLATSTGLALPSGAGGNASATAVAVTGGTAWLLQLPLQMVGQEEVLELSSHSLALAAVTAMAMAPQVVPPLLLLSATQ